MVFPRLAFPVIPLSFCPVLGSSKLVFLYTSPVRFAGVNCWNGPLSSLHLGRLRGLPGLCGNREGTICTASSWKELTVEDAEPKQHQGSWFSGHNLLCKAFWPLTDISLMSAVRTQAIAMIPRSRSNIGFWKSGKTSGCSPFPNAHPPKTPFSIAHAN